MRDQESSSQGITSLRRAPRQVTLHSLTAFFLGRFVMRTLGDFIPSPLPRFVLTARRLAGFP